MAVGRAAVGTPAIVRAAAAAPIRRPDLRLGRSGALFLHLCGFSDPIAQVVQLCPADVATGGDLDLGDDRRVDREGALDAHAEADLADRERLPGTASLPADHDALEDLDALAGPLDHAHVNPQRVARGECRNVVAQRDAVDEIGAVHGATLQGPEN